MTGAFKNPHTVLNQPCFFCYDKSELNLDYVHFLKTIYNCKWSSKQVGREVDVKRQSQLPDAPRNASLGPYPDGGRETRKGFGPGCPPRWRCGVWRELTVRGGWPSLIREKSPCPRWARQATRSPHPLSAHSAPGCRRTCSSCDCSSACPSLLFYASPGGSETRFSPVSPTGSSTWRFRSSGVETGTCWKRIPAPAPAAACW